MEGRGKEEAKRHSPPPSKVVKATVRYPPEGESPSPTTTHCNSFRQEMALKYRYSVSRSVERTWVQVFPPSVVLLTAPNHPVGVPAARLFFWRGSFRTRPDFADTLNREEKECVSSAEVVAGSSPQIPLDTNQVFSVGKDPYL